MCTEYVFMSSLIVIINLMCAVSNTIQTMLVHAHHSSSVCLFQSEETSGNVCSLICFSVSLFLSQSLIEAHDKVAAKCYEMPHTAMNSNASLTSSLMPADAVRVIGIQKKAGEPLVS